MLSPDWRCSWSSADRRCSNVGAALTTSEWSTILLPTKVWLILAIWWYMCICFTDAWYAMGMQHFGCSINIQERTYLRDKNTNGLSEYWYFIALAATKSWRRGIIKRRLSVHSSVHLVPCYDCTDLPFSSFSIRLASSDYSTHEHLCVIMITVWCTMRRSKCHCRCVIWSCHWCPT